MLVFVFKFVNVNNFVSWPEGHRQGDEPEPAVGVNERAHGASAASDGSAAVEFGRVLKGPRKGSAFCIC